MEIYYEPDLLEEVIKLEIDRREVEENDLNIYKEYNGLRESVYDIDDEDEREEAFEELDKKFFAKLKLDGDGFAEILEDYPLIKENVGLLEIRRAYTREEESVNISNQELESGLKAAIIRFRSQCFLNLEGHKRIVRHEFMHLSDILDDDFGYSNKPFGRNPSEEAFIRDRFRTIWDIYIESRLERKGKDIGVGKDNCYKEFVAFYDKIPEKERDEIFEKLWEMESLSHTKIVDLAKDPYELMKLLDVERDENAEKVVLPGTACPLCKFPTYHHIRDISPEAQAAIREDFPDWNDEWACERCLDLYALKAAG